MNDNLYTLPVENIETTNFCGGPCTEGCVDVAAIPGAADAFVVRDSKPEAPAGSCASPRPSWTTSPSAG